MTDIRYPNAFDGDDNLYHVTDSANMVLAEDHKPGNAWIVVGGDLSILPEVGIVTLTDQCTSPELRAVSFRYTVVDRTGGRLGGLTLEPGFVDVPKSRRITEVTCNVMASHHNVIKDALIAIEDTLGRKGTIDVAPFGDTMEGRINFLRKIVLQPRAWFTANRRVGNVPLEVEFENKSFRLGTDGTSGSVEIRWDFGDNTTSVVSTVQGTSVAPDVPDAYVIDMDGGKIKKTYYNAGLYDVRLTITNDFGSDEVVFDNFVNARIPAPSEAIIRFTQGEGQIATTGTPSDGIYTVTPRIRAPINTLIQLSIPDGEPTGNPGYSYAGEPLNGYGSPLDGITSYTWALGDDLNHPNSPETKAAYSVGGYYDLKLRVDTEFGAFRITTYRNAFDIVENDNLWMWLYTDDTRTAVRCYEYGLMSQTFKLATNVSQVVTTDDSFLTGQPEEARQKREFRRNTAFATRDTTPSGQGGTARLYWASGRSAVQSASEEEIRSVDYNAFTDTYTSQPPILRPWNWIGLSSPSSTYFCFGKITGTQAPGTSYTNTERSRVSNATNVNPGGGNPTSSVIGTSDFENGAQELLENPGGAAYGHLSVTRSSWKDNTGYFVRNDSVGDFFKLKSFYRTEGTLSNPFRTVRKLIDVQGPTKEEGQLGDLTFGIYLFNNSGSISVYGVASSVWYTAGPGINSAAYRTLQDTSNSRYDDPSNTLLVATDKDRRAYVTFDYSNQVFLKFSEVDRTFSTLGSRPVGQQWMMSIY